MAFQSVNLIAMGRQQVVREWVDGDGPTVGGGLCWSVGGWACCPCLALAASAALERTRGHHQPVLSRAPHHLVVEQTARYSFLLLLAIWKSFSNLSQVDKLQMKKLAAVELEHFSES